MDILFLLFVFAPFPVKGKVTLNEHCNVAYLLSL